VTSNAERAAILTEALHAGLNADQASLARLYTDDVKAWTPSQATASAAELLAELERRDEAFSDVELAVTPLDVGDDYACAEWRVSMSHTGTLELREASFEPTGLRITVNGVTVAEFRDDRICALRQYWDELAVFEQLGLFGETADPSQR
jgi:ketosteroid isomerase-like protein